MTFLLPLKLAALAAALTASSAPMVARPSTQPASAPLAKMAALCAALRDIGGKHGVEAGLTARCGNGIVHAWFAADKDAAGIVGEARQAASACGGLLMVEAAPLAVRKSVEVWPRPNAYDLMRRLKTAFDPGNTLNPGKLFGGQP